jgi:hypothetical protein
MTSKIELYRTQLRQETDWMPYLMANSGLPGPRANLELVEAVAREGTREQFVHLLNQDADTVDTNSPQVFLLVCGLVGLGKLAAEGEREYLPTLRRSASDPRWRVREAVAIALQHLGQADMDALVDEMERWSQGGWLEKRAVAAALAEPALLKQAQYAVKILDLFENMTESILKVVNRRDEQFLVFRQAMAYAWSVVVAAYPGMGKPHIEGWMASQDKDVAWIMKENLKKSRLLRMDSAWVERMQAKSLERPLQMYRESSGG